MNMRQVFKISPITYFENLYKYENKFLLTGEIVYNYLLDEKQIRNKFLKLNPKINNINSFLENFTCPDLIFDFLNKYYPNFKNKSLKNIINSHNKKYIRLMEEYIDDLNKIIDDNSIKNENIKLGIWNIIKLILYVKIIINILNYQYDYLGRLISKDLNNTKKVEYTYLSNGNKTSTIIKSMKINDDVYEYSYDKLSNITDIYLNKELISHYEYDVYNELISVMDYQNNKKYLYAYDAEGNILSKKEYNLEDNSLIREDGYTYSNVNWSDQLTKCNNDIITYDNIGNPLTIGSKEISWINGRELQSIKDGETIISFKYNKDGIRKEKRINNRSITYFTEGSKIIFERRGNNKSRCDIL